MDTLQLALPYYICTVAAWGSAAVCGVAAWKRLRPPWVLLLAGGFLLLGAAFFLIAATAGTGGHITRSQVAEPIRLLCLAGGLLWITWLVLFTRSVVRVEKQRPTG
jgi:hypothetical protein